MSKYSDTRSASTAGANGRKDSRYLIFRFITDCIFVLRGSPIIETGPKRPRAKLHSALDPTDDFPFLKEPRESIHQLIVINLLIDSPRRIQFAADFIIGALRARDRNLPCS